MKAGVALSDIMTGLNAAIGILAALNHRHASGKGQHIDVALLDCTLAAMTNIAQYYLTSGTLAPRLGNAHSSIVPYQVFETKDGHIIIAVGNNTQFQRLCAFLGKPEWGSDLKYAANSARVTHRAELVPMLAAEFIKEISDYWISGLADVDVPCGPVNTMDQTFDMEQIKAREMKIDMSHPLSSKPISLVGSPIKMSDTPPSYDLPPPQCGAHTDEVLRDVLEMNVEEIAALRGKNII